MVPSPKAPLGQPFLGAPLISESFFPAALYFLSEFIMVDQEAAKQKLKPLPSEELPSLRRTLVEGWPYILPLVCLVLFLGVLWMEVGRAALWGCVVLLGAIAVKSLKTIPKESVTPRVSVSMVLDALEGGARMMVLVGMACAAAGLIIGSFMITGLGVRLSTDLLIIAHENSA